MTGLSPKKPADRFSETPDVKEARISFLLNYVLRSKNPRSVFFYFDWSSFADSNFKRLSWSLRGQKSLTHHRYAYSCLHLLALVSNERVEAYQMVRGTLCSQIVFNFLSGALDFLLQTLERQNCSAVVILDNSPLNISNALVHFCIRRRVTLLFSAPNSSFLNPIEMLFAFTKAPLKRRFSCSKYPQ